MTRLAEIFCQIDDANARDPNLEPATGGRVLAALFDDVRHGRLHGPALFWHTHAADPGTAGSDVDAHALPREFREFFVAR